MLSQDIAGAPMDNQSLEKRVEVLEKEVAALKDAGERVTAKPDWHSRIGKFKDDPGYDEAMRLGRRYRRRQPKC